MISTIDPAANNYMQIVFSNQPDTILWKWDKNGSYSTKSAYKILIGGMIRWHFHYIWSAKVTLSAKIFAYLMIHGRILTRDVLRKRGLQVELICVCCQNCPVESILHLLFLWSFAVEAWFHVATSMNRPIMKIAGSVQKILEDSWEMVKAQGGMSKKEWSSRKYLEVPKWNYFQRKKNWG